MGEAPNPQPESTFVPEEGQQQADQGEFQPDQRVSEAAVEGQQLDQQEPAEQPTGETEASETEPIHQQHQLDSVAAEVTKAQTLADVVKDEEGFKVWAHNRSRSFDESMANHQEFADQVTGFDPEEEAERRAEIEEESDPSYAARLTTQLEADKADYPNKSKEWVREHLEETKLAIETELNPYDVLYDVAPGYFAELPTKEFIEKAREFKEIDTATLQANRNVGWIDQELTGLAKCLKNGELVYSDEAEILGSNIAVILDLEDDRDGRIFAASVTDTFNHSGKENLEKIKNRLEEVAAQLAEKKAAALSRKQEFLDQFKPETEAVAA